MNRQASALAVQDLGGGTNPPCTGFAADVLPEAKRPIPGVSSQTGVSTRYALKVCPLSLLFSKNIPSHMKDKHYYLVRETSSDDIQLVYNYSSFTYSNGVTDYDIRTIVFYKQKRWGLWGWDCGTSVIDFEQNVKFEEILAEVSKEEVDALFDVMKEATDEAKKWIDDGWKEFSESERSEEPNPKNDTTCGCRCEGGKYPFFTFMNDQTHERVCLWSDLLIHGTESDSPFTPDGSWGTYYGIPQSVFEKACELHKTMSNKFVRQYRDFVKAKTGITIPIKEYTPEEIEEEKAKIEERGKALRAELEAMAKLRS